MVTASLSVCRRATQKGYSLFTPCSKCTVKSVISSSVLHPLGNGRDCHLMHVNANKTPTLTLSGFKLKVQETATAVQQTKTGQVPGSPQGPATLALTFVTLLKLDLGLFEDWELAGELELQSGCHRYFCQPVELHSHALTFSPAYTCALQKRKAGKGPLEGYVPRRCRLAKHISHSL